MHPLLVSAVLATTRLAVDEPPIPGQGSRGTLLKNLKQAGEEGAGFSAQGRTNPLGIVTRVIQVLFSVLGVVFLVLTVYGGFLWMTAQGNEEQVTKAKNVIKNGIIGLAVMLGAYIISYTVLRYFTQATTGLETTYN